MSYFCHPKKIFQGYHEVSTRINEASENMKVNSKIYRGIEYVQLNDLPKEQKESISSSLNEDNLIKILIDKTIVSNCIQYKHYEMWFDNVFKKSIVVPTVKVERIPEPSSMAIALGKV